MLRKRRQSLPGFYRDLASAEPGANMRHKKAMKLKMSPFPEVRGVPLKESSHRLNQLTEVKQSLQFLEPEPQVELGKAVSTNTPLPRRTKTESQTEATSQPSIPQSSTTAKSVESDEPKVQKPAVEYIVPDTATDLVCSSREFKLGSFPPQDAESAPGPSTEHALKPSSVVQLERHLTPMVRREQGRERAGSIDSSMTQQDSQSTSLTSVWDSVVSWMKQAVDFVTVEADPTTPARPQGKKRPHPDDIQPAPGSKVPKLTNQRAAAGERGVASSRQSRRSSKRMSFGGFGNARPSEGLGDLLSNKLPSIEETSSQKEPAIQHSTQIESPTTLLTTQFSHNLAFKSPVDVAMMVNPSLFKFAAQKYQFTNDGLNSILDGSPLPVAHKKAPRIRRQSLSKYYGRSVDSPNLSAVSADLITVRRSPRLAEKASVTPPAPCVPPPPPPPPLPHTPHAPPPPPTPKIPSMYDCDLNDNSTPSRQGVDQSRAMLQKMQNRLRTRMKRKVVGGETVAGKNKEMATVDVKTRQWAEIQALSRKISVPEFLMMAETKKTQIRRALEELQLKVPQTMTGISDSVELLQDASQWFSGGVKEMRECLPLYKSLEKKIEVLNEFTQLSSQMRDSSPAELPVGIHYSELHTSLAHIRSEFDSKHRHWGPVILSNAQSWQDLGLPVCPRALLKAREYICHLVEVFVKCALLEAGKIEGILLSLKCVRTRQTMDRLRGCMQLVRDSQSYFQSTPSPDTCPGCDQCDSMPATNGGSEEICLVSTLLKYILDASSMYINIALGQFEGFVSKSKRQEVCEHFELVLKITNTIKSLVCDLNNTKPSRVKASGVICLIPEGEPLGNLIYTSCVSLIQHIMSQTKECVQLASSPRTQEKQSKEVILWMMFGCKYVHQTLEVLGSDKANARGVSSLLSELQQMENLLPN